MKKIIALFSLVCFIFSVSAMADEALVASKGSDKYHYANCTAAAKISADKKIEFKTPEEAAAAGYTPCKKCNPPTESFVASKNSDKYHKRSCSLAKKITGDNSITFLTQESAQKAGYKPCQACLGNDTVKIAGGSTQPKTKDVPGNTTAIKTGK